LILFMIWSRTACCACGPDFLFLLMRDLLFCANSATSGSTETEADAEEDPEAALLEEDDEEEAAGSSSECENN